ncbi:MAG: histidine phosphatase family protein [Steroidobacteraceae bacterium]
MTATPTTGRRLPAKEATTSLILVRHGHVPGIAPQRFRGRAEFELTALGIQQARAAASRIARECRPSIVYTSPLRRCVETGRLIAKASGVRSRVLEGLNDLDYGRWQGKTHAYVRKRWPVEYERWKTFPDLIRFPSGESLQDLALRVSDVLRELLARREGDTAVLVGHDASIRALLLQALGMPLGAYWRIQQDPAAISELDCEGGRISVRRLNDTAHLAGLGPALPKT